MQESLLHFILSKIDASLKYLEDQLNEMKKINLSKTKKFFVNGCNERHLKENSITQYRNSSSTSVFVINLHNY